MILDDQLTFKDHVVKTARSCRFALHNIRKIRPFLTEHATKILIQALVISRLDYCNTLLAGLPTCAIRALQMIQNAAARLVFNEPNGAFPLHGTARLTFGGFYKPGTFFSTTSAEVPERIVTTYIIEFATREH